MTAHTKRPGWWPTHDELDNARWHERATRRHVVRAGAGAVALAATGGSLLATGTFAQDSATPSNASGICVLIPELTLGPYYLDDMLVRDDITEGKAGVPLDLEVTVVDATTCAPIENAAVDIWHCDARGFYSGFVDADPDSQDPIGYQDDGSNPDTFLRGVLLTDANGLVRFRTIYPGWYQGRTIHIHMAVHTGGTAEDGTYYEGGTTAHVGQLAFSDAFTERVAQVEPYASRPSTWARLEEDGVFRGMEDGAPAFFVSLTPVDEADLAQGVTGTITIGIDPSAST